MGDASLEQNDSDLSREIAFLGEMHERATRLTLRAAAAAVVGAMLLIANLGGHLGLVFGWVGVLGGPYFLLIGLTWFRLLPTAHKALAEAPIDARLEVKLVKGGYGFKRFTMARLWPAASNDQWLATFSETMHWHSPGLLAVNRVPARVYGVPARGRVIVASCSQGVVVGRIRRSHLERGI